jgi:hypothetical protein
MPQPLMVLDWQQILNVESLLLPKGISQKWSRIKNQEKYLMGIITFDKKHWL